MTPAPTASTTSPAPTTPAPAPTPTTAAPNAPNPQTNPTIATPATPTDATQPHVNMFAKILTGLTGGPVRTVNPDGSVTTKAASAPSAAKMLVASALAGLFAPKSYRETPFGPALDKGATASNAFGAGAAANQNVRAQAQSLSDEQQSRKLMTLQNNAKLLQMQVASSHLKHQMLDDMNADGQKFLQPFTDYEMTRAADAPSAFLAQGLRDTAILKPGSQFKLTDSNVVADGVVQVYNPETKEYEPHPTYSVLNPALKDIQLPEDVTKKLSEINPQYADIYKSTGGNVRLPVTAYVSAMHEYQTVTQGEHILNTLSQALNGDKAKQLDLSSVVKANRGQTLAALNQVEAAVSAGNTPGLRADNLLDTILKTPNGDKLLDLLGLTPSQADEKIQDISNERARKAALAKEGGIGDKAPADPKMIQEITDSANRLPKDQRDAIMSGVNPNGLTVGEAEKLKDKILDSVNKNREFAAKNPSTPDSTSTTKSYANEWVDKNGTHYDLNDPIYNMVEGGQDPSQLTKRGKNYDANLKKANDYSFARYGKTFDLAKAQEDYKYANAKSTQDTLRLLRSLTGEDNKNAGGTLSQLQSQFDALGNTRVPKMNELENWISQNEGKPEVTNFASTILGVSDEMGKILGGGVATDSSRQEAREILDKAFSGAQGRGAIAAIRGALANRQNSLTANNRYLMKDFGQMALPQMPRQHVVPAGSFAHRTNGVIDGYKTADGKVVMF